MAGVFFGELLAAEDVAEVAAASCAGDFGAVSVAVEGFFNGPGDGVIETGPATVAVEFVVGTVERRVATAANVGAGFEVVVVFTGEGHFGAFVDDDAGLFGGEIVILHGLIIHQK